MLLRLTTGVFRRSLCSEGRGLSRPLEPLRSGSGPGDRVALNIRNGDYRVVECRAHMGDAGSNVLLLAAAHATRLYLGHGLGIPYLVVFFLPAIGLAGPLRVRALV